MSLVVQSWVHVELSPGNITLQRPGTCVHVYRRPFGGMLLAASRRTCEASVVANMLGHAEVTGGGCIQQQGQGMGSAVLPLSLKFHLEPQSLEPNAQNDMYCRRQLFSPVTLGMDALRTVVRPLDAELRALIGDPKAGSCGLCEGPAKGSLTPGRAGWDKNCLGARLLRVGTLSQH